MSDVMVSIRTCRDCGCLETEVRDGRVWYWPHEENCPENPANQPMFFSKVSDPDSWIDESITLVSTEQTDQGRYERLINLYLKYSPNATRIIAEAAVKAAEELFLHPPIVPGDSIPPLDEFLIGCPPGET